MKSHLFFAQALLCDLQSPSSTVLAIVGKDIPKHHATSPHLTSLHDALQLQIRLAHVVCLLSAAPRMRIQIAATQMAVRSLKLRHLIKQVGLLGFEVLSLSKATLAAWGCESRCQILSQGCFDSGAALVSSKARKPDISSSITAAQTIVGSGLARLLVLWLRAPAPAPWVWHCACPLLVQMGRPQMCRHLPWKPRSTTSCMAKVGAAGTTLHTGRE